MKPIEWDPENNKRLMQERGVSFEMVEEIIANDAFITAIDHPNQLKYPHQRMYIIELRGYLYQVPFVEDDEKIFLKTIIPNRKLEKRFINKPKRHED